MQLGRIGPDTPAWHLSVDGMSPTGPNLSHWPGNRTPPQWKADLSTGICLAFAAAPEAERGAFLSGATIALNDHYDTDGFLSLLTVLRPEIALPRRTALLEAAATGDFQAFQSVRGFAVDRIVLRLAAAGSPVRHEFAGLSAADKDFARYRWLLDHAEQVLDRPDEFAALYRDELAELTRQIADPEIHGDLEPGIGLALVHSPGSVHRMVLNTRAADCFRVLHVQHTSSGNLFRYHDRTESWFEVRTFTPPARRDLEPLRNALAAREAPDSDGAWCLDPADQPVPELYHGIPAAQAYGEISRVLTPSSLDSDEVCRMFAEFFASPAPTGAASR